MSEKIQIRMQQKRMNARDWLNSPLILLEGELGIESDTGFVKVGNGTSRFSELKYLTGPKGATGERGPAGPTGPAGRDGVVTFENLSQTQRNSLKGDRGPIGERGPAGPIGERGPAGPTGPQGIQGIQGRTGERGPTGERGLTGPTGPQGIQGRTGDRGPTGLAGPAGPVGPAGRNGINSYTHIKYSNNSNGSGMNDNPNATYLGIYTGDSSTPPSNHSSYKWTKIKGDDGRQGIAGPQGIQGRTGDRGPTGERGPAGPQGIQGRTGERGPTGAAGENIINQQNRQPLKYWAGTEQQYNAISNKDPNTIYDIFK